VQKAPALGQLKALELSRAFAFSGSIGIRIVRSKTKKCCRASEALPVSTRDFRANSRELNR
jgi:hypothetical protein